VKELVTTLTQRGQVTVPAEVRRLLGLKPRDKVAFMIDDGVVQLRPAAFTLETVFASVPPTTRTEDFGALSRAARDEKVRRDYGDGRDA
jgi:AbrB family looped-hinge helix DNA binding protein